jgi:DNA invertase Pin-like site-specific DNA recombinase
MSQEPQCPLLSHPTTAMGPRVVIQVEFERNQVISRTKSALAAAEARGAKLGAAGPANLRRTIESRQAAANYFANKLSGVLAAFHADGLSQRATVQQLNALGSAPNGGNWSLLQVQRVIKRPGARAT